MITRKELKKKGRLSLKKHYLIFVAACLISAFLASEFKGSLNFSTLQNPSRTMEEDELNVTVSKRSIGWQDVFQAVFTNSLEKDGQLSRQLKDTAATQSVENTPGFHQIHGILANTVNQSSSGSLPVTIAAAANSLANTTNPGVILLLLAGTGSMLAFWIFVQNTYLVILRRIFLEGHTYDHVPMPRFLYLMRIKKWMKASWIMLAAYLCQLLWNLTLVGGIVKHYSYMLVPYITAENPDMTARQAITLSRRMMRGHKWECFIFEMSFIGWQLLGLASFGIFNVIYTNPYKIASFTEYYVRLRSQAIENHLPLSELLSDTYLYEKADPLDLMEKYVDILDIMENPSPEIPRLPGIRGFFSRNFGILLFWRDEEKEYERLQALQIKNQELSQAVKGLVYPTRLYHIPEEKKRRQIESLHYRRQYSIWSLLVIFFGLSCFGWLWEVVLHLITSGELVNRGSMNGPWVPIYGAASVLILTLLYRLRKNPGAEFFAAVLLCGSLEYITSLVMEIATDGTKWWDYSSYLLNLNGRVCAEGLLVFGVGGLTVVYILAPLADNFLREADRDLLRLLCILLTAAFCLDLGYTYFHPNEGKGITDTETVPAVSRSSEDFSKS